MKALVFDVDGTLYHQAPLRLQVLKTLFRSYWREPAEGCEVLRILHAFRTAHEQLRWAGLDVTPTAQTELASRNLDCDAGMVAAVVDRWMVREPLPLLLRHRRKGLVELLDGARELGWKLGVLSDYPARPKLEALGLTSHFDVVRSAQDPEIGRLKPDPRGLLAVLRALGVEPTEAIYIGDRVDTDAAVARAAGVPSLILQPRTPLIGREPSWSGVKTFRQASQQLGIKPRN